MSSETMTNNFKRKLRDLIGEMHEEADVARVGSRLLRRALAEDDRSDPQGFLEASRFLDGTAEALKEAAGRLKSIVDDEDIPF